MRETASALKSNVDRLDKERKKWSQNISVGIEGKTDSDVKRSWILLPVHGFQVMLDKLLQMNISGSSRDEEPKTAQVEMWKNHLPINLLYKSAGAIMAQSKRKM